MTEAEFIQATNGDETQLPIFQAYDLNGDKIVTK